MAEAVAYVVEHLLQEVEQAVAGGEAAVPVLPTAGQEEDSATTAEDLVHATPSEDEDAIPTTTPSTAAAEQEREEEEEQHSELKALIFQELERAVRDTLAAQDAPRVFEHEPAALAGPNPAEEEEEEDEQQQQELLLHEDLSRVTDTLDQSALLLLQQDLDDTTTTAAAAAATIPMQGQATPDRDGEVVESQATLAMAGASLAEELAQADAAPTKERPELGVEVEHPELGDQGHMSAALPTAILDALVAEVLVQSAAARDMDDRALPTLMAETSLPEDAALPAVADDEDLDSGKQDALDLEDTQVPGDASDNETMVGQEEDVGRRALSRPPSAGAAATTTTSFPGQCQGQSSLMEEVWLSIFTPGMNPRVQGVMHATFMALFLSLATLFVLADFNLHVLFLLFIAVCLYSTTVW